MKDHSQNGEASIAMKFFGDFRGTLLDCGSNDGISLSNSRNLIELGWNAVLVEPAKTAFAKLVKLYNHSEDNKPIMRLSRRAGDGAPTQVISLVQAAITTANGPIAFHSSGTHLKKGDTDLLSTTVPSELARWKKSGEVFTETTVRGITFATLLKECGVSRFDFISVDCEGVDLQILQQMDLTALGCRMLCIEVNRADQRPFDEHCARHGMKLHHRNYENAIYVSR